MKSQNILSLTGITKVIFFATLLIITSCTGQKKEGNQEEGQSTAKTNVSPPQIDIHTAVVTGNLEALKQHIAAGTDLNEKDPFGGSSPLISAAVFGKTEEARILIEAGADVNFQNNDGSTALHSAAFFCRPEIVKMLLDKGADKTIENKYEATAYQSVAGPFSEVKSSYDMMGKVLGPMGLKLDYPYIEKTRPEIAAMLK
jgi:ankyrin repeat protein